MDLSFPIFEIAIQELEERPPNGFVGSPQPILPLCYDAQNPHKESFYLYITFTLEKVDIVAF